MQIIQIFWQKKCLFVTHKAMWGACKSNNLLRYISILMLCIKSMRTQKVCTYLWLKRDSSFNYLLILFKGRFFVPISRTGVLPLESIPVGKNVEQLSCVKIGRLDAVVSFVGGMCNLILFSF